MKTSKRTPHIPKMQTHNHTPWMLEQITTFPRLGSTVNGWRQRNVVLYAHPDDAALLISVGETFDHTMQVIAIEPRQAFQTALAYAARGKIYRSE